MKLLMHTLFFIQIKINFDYYLTFQGCVWMPFLTATLAMDAFNPEFEIRSCATAMFLCCSYFI